jgi:hypothetical protein
VRSAAGRQEADALADRLLLPEDDSEPRESHGLLETLAQSNLAPAFVVQVLQRLRDLRPHVRPAYDWIEQALADRSIIRPAEIVMAEHQAQASRVGGPLRNIITSMRHHLRVSDWSGVLRAAVSLVDAAMRSPQRSSARWKFESQRTPTGTPSKSTRADAKKDELDKSPQRVLDRAERALVAKGVGCRPARRARLLADRRGRKDRLERGAARDRPPARTTALRLYLGARGCSATWVPAIALGSSRQLRSCRRSRTRRGTGLPCGR